MILQELFENRLSDLHAAYQDYLRIGKSQERADDFKNTWGMEQATWVKRHQDQVNKLTAHERSQPVGDEHLRYGSAVPPVAESIPFNQCPLCGGSIVHESELTEKQDACYHKVKSRYKVWPSAYASGALVQCRKKGVANWGNKSKKRNIAKS